MSLAINTTTPEGLVLAADSRQSFRNQRGMARIGSDNATKLFQINKRIGVAVTGVAFLRENDVLKSISKFIDEFTYKADVKNLDVREVAEKLHYLFNKKYDYKDQAKKLPEQAKADLQRQGFELLEVREKEGGIDFKFKDKTGQTRTGSGTVDPINLLVAGYNKDGNHEVYICRIPGGIEKKRDGNKKGLEYGSSWIGQTDVVGRIVLGYDPRIGGLKFVNEAAEKEGGEKINKQLRGLEYIVRWGTMALQDAVDFCTLLIQTTSAMQRFSDGVKNNPGDMPGVGGAVDVAIITPSKGFIWISKKKLTTGADELDLDEEPSLTNEEDQLLNPVRQEAVTEQKKN